MNLSNYQRINLIFYLFSRQVIILSASANKLAKLKGHAATYASLIMEELDPDDRGYIEVVLVQKQHLLSNSYPTGMNGLRCLQPTVCSKQCRFGNWRRCSGAW